MKKISFILLIVAALCFAACGNNQNKKAEAVAETTESCSEAKEKVCGGCDAQACSSAKACCGTGGCTQSTPASE